MGGGCALNAKPQHGTHVSYNMSQQEHEQLVEWPLKPGIDDCNYVGGPYATREMDAAQQDWAQKSEVASGQRVREVLEDRKQPLLREAVPKSSFNSDVEKAKARHFASTGLHVSGAQMRSLKKASRLAIQGGNLVVHVTRIMSVWNKTRTVLEGPALRRENLPESDRRDAAVSLLAHSKQLVALTQRNHFMECLQGGGDAGREALLCLGKRVLEATAVKLPLRPRATTSSPTTTPPPRQTQSCRALPRFRRRRPGTSCTPQRVQETH